MNIGFALMEKRYRLAEIDESLERYEKDKLNTLKEIMKIESMAFNGKIPLDEYHAMIKAVTKGIPIDKVDEHYNLNIVKQRIQKQKVLREIQVLNAMPSETSSTSPSTFDTFSDTLSDASNQDSEDRTPYIIFLMFLVLVAGGLFISIADNSITGFTGYVIGDAAPGQVGSPDYFLFTIVAGVIFAVFFLVVDFAYKDDS
ncbi:hypothetical protein ACFL96_11630 [Thermoproteota archaeon]